MPRSLDPDKYPPDFFLALDRAQLAPQVIAGADPGFRGYFQAFLRACESDPRFREKAKATQATSHKGDPADADPRKHGPHAIIQRRSDSAYAKLLARSLGTSVDSAAADAAADFLKRLEQTP
jgi:hypothetical protein